ncbi:MAG TPA: HDOD domain-containing protein [Bryobacteraceae bacterium]|nr:HDOD domain-containing protein [Bryobacteraceae bacterium]
MMTSEVAGRTELTLSRLNRLPAFNQTAVRLLARPFSDEDSIVYIESSFRSDPGLASQLLVAANSAAMGLRARVATLRHALAVLGINRIRALVVTVATSSYMRQFPAEAVRPIWAHGIATAVIAEQLAGYSDRLSGAALYTAGLTHDLGRLGLLAAERQRYGAFLEDEYENREQSDSVEWERFGVLHTVAGGLITQLWGFPENLCGHAENHHGESGFDTEEDRIVHTACLLADAMGYAELRLRSAEEPKGMDSIDDECRALVDERIQQYLG